MVQVRVAYFRHLERKGEIIASPNLEISEAIADIKVTGDITVIATNIAKKGDAFMKGIIKE